MIPTTAMKDLLLLKTGKVNKVVYQMELRA